MDRIKELRNLIDYNEWANRRVVASLKASSKPSSKAIRVLTHLLIAEKTWLMRLQKNLDSTGFNFWPAATLDECEALVEESARMYKEFVSDLREEQLETVARYKNSKGIMYETTCRDILTHMLMHSGYHRGQVAMAIRAEGEEPANTDYIMYVRERQK